MNKKSLFLLTILSTLFCGCFELTPDMANPAPEDNPRVCADGIDNNGDGATDCGEADCRDLDVCDGFGDADSDTDADGDIDTDTGYVIIDIDADADSDVDSDADIDTDYTGSQGVQPPMGICYDVIPGDGSGCYGVALAGVCASYYAACDADAACAALETCLNTECVNLETQDFFVCEQNCRELNPDGVDLYDSYQQCVYCDACADDCALEANDKGCSYHQESCDMLKTQCYGDEIDGSPACWGCAMGSECKPQVDACKNSAECQALENCRYPCNTMTGIEWQTCINACEAAHPDGVPILAAYYACIYCDACPVNCAADAAGKCL